MDEDETVAQTETAQEEKVETSQETTETAQVDWKAEAEKKDRAFQDQKKRAEKAEAESKRLKEANGTSETQQPKPADLSGKDVLALSGAGVTDDEDVDWLTKEVAPLYGGSVSKALSNKLVKDLLTVRREERQTADATPSGGSGRRAPTERSGNDLVNDARKGTLPENKSDIRKLVRARIGIKEQ